ncbi:MAG: UDP-3-O-(3-hydroxymyristoyl)glucosamine N-acyltransferase [Acidobacteriota bacterium]
MPSVSLQEIVTLTGGICTGDLQRLIHGVRSLAEAGDDDLSFLANPKYLGLLEGTAAGAVLVPENTAGDSRCWIRVSDPYYAFAQVLEQWFAPAESDPVVSPLSAVAPSARLGANVSIGPFVSIGENAVIGEGVSIHSGVSIGQGVSIGSGSTLYANVSVYRDCQIGNRCVVHAGAVIGSDGFGFATHEGVHNKIRQIGIVRIEDDVEVGAGTTIDRAALGETVIGTGTKIDNLVQIGHNVRIGRHCLIVAQVGIAGSTEIGDYCVFGGQAGVSGHLKLGSRVQAGAQAAVMKDWDGPVTLAGSPARPLRQSLRSEAMIHRLPEIMQRLKRLEKACEISAENLAPEERD